MTAESIKVYLDPATHHFLGDRLFQENDGGRLNGDRQEAPYAHLRERFTARGIPVHTADRIPDRVEAGVRHVYFSLGRLDNVRALSRRPDVTLAAYFAMECPIVEPSMYRAIARDADCFQRLYSWSDDASLRRFTGRPLAWRHFRWPQSFDDVHEALWRETSHRGFLAMINANKLPRVYWKELYTERMRAVEYFARTGEIDLYGKGWDAPSMRVGKTWVPWTIKLPLLALQKRWQQRFPDSLLVAARKAWRGPTPAKAVTLSRYNFALCFENCVMPGWITEKLFDCLFAGAVPVYWGAPDIGDAVPPDCFIDMRKFSGYPELHDFLKSRTPADLARYRDAARSYLCSPQYAQFGREAFTSIFTQCVDEIATAPEQ
jgi:hypothetical protein